MKKVITLLSEIVFLSALVATATQSSPSGSNKIDPALRSVLATQPSNQPLTVIIRLIQQTDVRQFSQLNHRGDRLKNMEQALHYKAEATQRNLISLLESGLSQSKVSHYTSFWVFNGLSVTALPDMILDLASQTEVASITADQTNIAPSTSAAEPNLSLIGTPDLWNLGLHGQGIVVASLDSGVDIHHPELAARWRGGGNSWFDPYRQHLTTPTDVSGHGTWTMGVIVGGDAGGTSIGVAPQAQWIAAKIFNDSGNATATAIHQAFQWLLDPDGDPDTADAPHVVNNSWTYGSPGCNLEFQSDLQALTAVGIVPVFAAGNFGPSASTSASPANYPEAFAVGAVSNNDVIYGYSSRGPSACGEASTLYPELVAPGVNIYTTDLSGSYTAQTGTSLAAPHVAGGLALLLSGFPDLTAASQRAALLASAHDLGISGSDNSYGYGRLDLLAAYNWLSSLPPPSDTTGPTTNTPVVSPNPTNAAQAVSVSAVISDPDASGFQSAVAGAEYFIGSLGTNGSGIAMTPSDGSFDSPVESVATTLAPAQLTALGEGSHTLYIHGRDAVGNWGAAVGASLVIDTTPPSVASLGAALTNHSVTLSGTATDPAPGTTVQAEWFKDTLDPGVGQANAMTVAGQNLNATFDVGTWSPGAHTLSVRARDAAGNWSPVAITTVNVTDNIFADGFETGSFSAWTGGVTGTRVSVTQAAGMLGSYFMTYALGGNITPGYVTDITPANETNYHARFYFNPNGANPGKSNLTIFSAKNSSNSLIFQVVFRLNGSSYQVSAAVARAGGTSNTNWFTLANTTAHPIEIAWQSGAIASFSLYTDGALRQTLTNLNTGSYLLDSVQLGASAGLVKNASGMLYFDAFASTRATVIGP